MVRSTIPQTVPNAAWAGRAIALWVTLAASSLASAQTAHRTGQSLDSDFVRRSAPGTVQVIHSDEQVLEKETGFEAKSVTLRELIGWAYPVTSSQVSGGPDWIDKTAFDVIVTPKTGLSREQALQRFLSERFALSVHTQTAPVFTLNVGTARPKLRPSHDPTEPTSLKESPGKIVGKAVTVRQLAAAISRYLGRPVLDRTRLEGRYDVELEWRVRRSSDKKPAEATMDPQLAAALHSDLGLEVGSFPYEQLIVDHADLPVDD
jgi:uncharacterized protein (TIGR03435 family)